MDRRVFVHGTAAVALATTGLLRASGRLVLAQNATPTASPLAGLALPELMVTLTDQGFTASPASIAAGWTLVTFENRSREEEDAPDIMLLPAGETAQSVIALVATPTEGPPAWAYTTTFAGGPFARSGERAQAVVHLTPGDWLVWSGGEAYPGAPLTVSGSEGGAPSLTADVAVTLKEFTFEGLDHPVPTGPRLWQITNSGTQPHIMLLVALPNGVTTEQLLAGVQAMMGGTPAAGGVDLSSARSVGGCSTLSVGQSLWLPVNLEAGTYGALCFFPDQQTGAPHVLMGMGLVFTAA